MKNKIFLAVLALAIGTSPVLAATSTTATSTGYRLSKPFQDIREEYKEKREEVKNKIKDDREEAKDKIKAVATSTKDKDERREKVEGIRIDRIRAFAAQMQERLEAALARSQKFVDRITSFLNEREAAGQNVTKARAKVTEANAVIASSTIKVNAIPTQIEAALNASSTPKDIFANIKKIVGEGVTAIKAAQQKVVEAVKALKTIPTGGNNATSTATSTSSN